MWTGRTQDGGGYPSRVHAPAIARHAHAGQSWEAAGRAGGMGRGLQQLLALRAGRPAYRGCLQRRLRTRVSLSAWHMHEYVGWLLFTVPGQGSLLLKTNRQPLSSYMGQSAGSSTQGWKHLNTVLYRHVLFHSSEQGQLRIERAHGWHR